MGFLGFLGFSLAGKCILVGTLDKFQKAISALIGRRVYLLQYNVKSFSYV